jgi:hypothetical protein
VEIEDGVTTWTLRIRLINLDYKMRLAAKQVCSSIDCELMAGDTDLGNDGGGGGGGEDQVGAKRRSQQEEAAS